MKYIPIYTLLSMFVFCTSTKGQNKTDLPKNNWRYDGNTFTNFTKNYVTYIFEDKKGNIWASGGSDNGQGFALSCYDGNTVTDFKGKEVQK